MKSKFLKWLACVSVTALVSAVVPVAMAQCGLPNQPIKPMNAKPMNWNPRSQAGRPSFVRAAFDGDDHDGELAIVGMWFLAEWSSTIRSLFGIPMELRS